MRTEVAKQKLDIAEDDGPRAIVHRVEFFPVSDTDPTDGDFDVIEETRKPFLRRHWMSIVFLVLPTFFAAVYLFGIASDVYVSESKYIVRSTTQDSDNGIGALIQSRGLARAVDDTYAVNEYLLSRDAANALAKLGILTTMMARKEGDVFGRYPSPLMPQSDYQFYRAYKRFVDITVDSATGISTLSVYGFRAEDSQQLSQQILKIGEAFINSLNDRAHRDALTFATNLLTEARARMAKVEGQLADYRNKEMIVDPAKEGAAALTQLSAMSTELSRMEASLAQQVALAPNSPSIKALRERITSYRDEILKLKAKVVGGKDSLAGKLRGFEMLTLEQSLASRALASASLELEKARHDEMTQRIYLQQVVEPNRPDRPLLPRRLLDLLLVFGTGLVLYWLVRSFASTTMDHQA